MPMDRVQLKNISMPHFCREDGGARTDIKKTKTVRVVLQFQINNHTGSGGGFTKALKTSINEGYNIAHFED